MNSNPNTFTWWATPCQRAFRNRPEEVIAPATRRPFSKPISRRSSGKESALQTAQILPFTGSNTPYQSHE